MRCLLVLSVLAAVVAAAPHPQDISFDEVEAAPDPVIITPSAAVASQVATVAPVADQIAAAAAAVLADPAVNDTLSSSKRDIVARDASTPCAKQPLGKGPVASPDSAEAFQALDALTAMATNAATPYGYSLVFANKQASLQASVFLTLATISSYDVAACQSLCDRDSQCVAFNMYAERDPTLAPDASNCPSPRSTTNYKCATWGAPVTVEQAANYGETRASFQIVIAASNAYNKNSPPAAVSGFTGPTGFGGATNAPLDSNGKDTFMGSKFFPFSQSQGMTFDSCTTACTTQTAYNKNHPNQDGSYKTCAFVNGYVLSKDGIPQGLYCSMYTQVWAASYATNFGQYRGSVRYTVSNSYGYNVANSASTRPAPPSQCQGSKRRRRLTITSRAGSCQKLRLTRDSLSQIPALSTFTHVSKRTCGLDCIADSNCLSFSFTTTDNSCRLYSQSVGTIQNAYATQFISPGADADGSLLYDYNCYAVDGSECYSVPAK